MLLLSACPVWAEPTAVAGVDAVAPVRTIRPGEIIASTDLRLQESAGDGGLSSPAEAVGLAARRLLVAGKPLRPGDLGPPVLVHRNSAVPLVFARGGLAIRAEGRALADGAEGDRVRVMNLASRQIVSGIVLRDGSVAAGEAQ
jgi:flagella basal body P-ring formation protein FlgA